LAEKQVSTTSFRNPICKGISIYGAKNQDKNLDAFALAVDTYRGLSVTVLARRPLAYVSRARLFERPL